MSHHITAMADDAHAAATRDRKRAADHVLDAAVKDTIALIRDGGAAYAPARLTRAGRSADRILGPKEKQ